VCINRYERHLAYHICVAESHVYVVVTLAFGQLDQESCKALSSAAPQILLVLTNVSANFTAGPPASLPVSLMCQLTRKSLLSFLIFSVEFINKLVFSLGLVSETLTLFLV